MKTLPIFHIKILQILACRNGMICTLEDLTSFLNPLSNATTVITDHLSIQNENQARVLEALIFLDDEGYIFLNSDTDGSIITIKGLIKMGNNVFCN